MKDIPDLGIVGAFGDTPWESMAVSRSLADGSKGEVLDSALEQLVYGSGAFEPVLSTHCAEVVLADAPVGLSQLKFRVARRGHPLLQDNPDWAVTTALPVNSDGNNEFDFGAASASGGGGAAASPVGGVLSADAGAASASLEVSRLQLKSG